MIEQIDFAAEKLSKEEYKTRRKELVEKLVVLQQEAHREEVGMVVLFEGWDGAGKGSRISDLVYNLDARATSVFVTPDIPEDEAELFNELDSGVTGYYPYLEPFWKSLGEQGTITFYDRGWYASAASHLLFSKLGKKAKKKLSKLAKNISTADFARSIQDYERMLVDSGYIVIKLFVHVSKKAQKERLEKLYNNPSTTWRVSKEKLKHAELYDELYPLLDTLLERSNFEFCPWAILNGEDKRQANISVLEAMVNSFEKRLKEVRKAKAAEEAKAIEDAIVAMTDQIPVAPTTSRFELVDSPPCVGSIDHTLKLAREEYDKQLKKEQKRLDVLERQLYQKRIPLIIMYEGWDAAGKGGNIKRVARALDARAYTIYPSAAPTRPELLHPHLWRYWTRLPKAGHVGIYDRSWYGRVLVERVEKLATIEEWSRAYDEINAFEHDLEHWGAILIKFWVNVSPEEQLVRFKERQENPEKQWKITDEDWRNREKYPQYKAAVDDMFRLTSTTHAPWIILESDDKLYARVKALRIINAAIEDRLNSLD